MVGVPDFKVQMLQTEAGMGLGRVQGLASVATTFSELGVPKEASPSCSAHTAAAYMIRPCSSLQAVIQMPLGGTLRQHSFTRTLMVLCRGIWHACSIKVSCYLPLLAVCIMTDIKPPASGCSMSQELSTGQNLNSVEPGY